ncbi:MAG: hypothetical protein NC417_07120 [Candidatus Gastranaerophilales bacterium]|nr:hypothetical protein [Candidatus Gastranaerophilales bacterium]
MFIEIFYILSCLGLSCVYGFGIYEGVKNNNKFEIIYDSVVAGIIIVMAILEIVEDFIS